MGWLAIPLALLGLAALLALLLVPYNLRVRRARRDHHALPPHVVESVLAELERAGARGDAVTLLLPDPALPVDDPCASRLGGLPYAEDGAWPTSGDRPDVFLIQALLDEPRLGDAWRGRLVQVFLVHDGEPTVFIHPAPDPARAVRPAPPAEPLPTVALRHLRIPPWRDEEDPLAWSDQLVRDVPAIRALLAPHTGDVPAVLARILSPRYGDRVDGADVAYVGGEPELIQNPHDPPCPDCGDPMRFLLQFGEMFPGLTLADGGVVYVYGCDRHPDRVRGFLDGH